MANSSNRNLTARSIEGIAGFRNYIQNAFARENITGWATYADAAGSIPVDGTGGSPNITLARNTSSPLRLDADFLITKDAANRQGEGVSYDFSIDSADKIQRMAIAFDYKASANFVTGQSSDLQVFIYDITNSALITVDKKYLLAASGTYVTTFSATSGSSYRLIFHIATTNASAWTFNYTNIVVSNATTIIGTNSAGPTITDWVSYPLQIGATTTPPTLGTVVTNSAEYRRVGDSIELRWDFYQSAGGSAGSGIYLFPLPSGLSIDTSKIIIDTTREIGIIGYGTLNTGGASASAWRLEMLVYDSTHLYGRFVDASTGGVAVDWSSSSNEPIVNASVASFVTNTIPILGFTSNVAIAKSGIISMAQVLASGTRVTGTPPTQIGQYRSYLRNAGAASYTETNGSPSTSPTNTNGILIYGGASWSSGDSANQPSRYDLFVGVNKSVKLKYFASTGKTGFIDCTPQQLSSDEIGFSTNYDPTTGILILQPNIDSGGSTRFAGTTGPNAFQANSYFDVIVSDNDFQIQLVESVPLLSDSSGAFSTTSISLVDITNLSVTITTSGEALFVGLIPDGVGEGYFFGSTDGDGFNCHILRDSTDIAGYEMTRRSDRQPISSVNTVDFPGSGTFTYKVQLASNTGASCQCNNAKLVVYKI